MWYEILPSVGIITAALTVPSVFSYYMHKFFQNNNPYRRDISSFPFNLQLYQRDKHLTGNVYVQKGLDSIPDE